MHLMWRGDNAFATSLSGDVSSAFLSSVGELHRFGPVELSSDGLSPPHRCLPRPALCRWQASPHHGFVATPHACLCAAMDESWPHLLLEPSP
uniref:Uncharacterized protein n=1 Tax=Setaria viridis TaxID=4556 RepID=A0A4U6W027_SETVI|nr:hypothetical protein SEVIR_2G392850v2 [Setaria viridis]